jgi:hypothetical protein
MHARSVAVALATLAGVATIAVVLAAGASAAGGDHTQTLTQNFHGLNTSTATNPCNGDTIDLSQSSNIVSHETFFPAGDEAWGTFTEEDKVVGTDEGTGVVFSGHSTFWGNFNLNNQNSNSTFTGSVHVTGSDGSSIRYHEVGHITMLPDGSISVSFDKPSITCG